MSVRLARPGRCGLWQRKDGDREVGRLRQRECTADDLDGDVVATQQHLASKGACDVTDVGARAELVHCPRRAAYVGR